MRYTQKASDVNTVNTAILNKKRKGKRGMYGPYDLVCGVTQCGIKIVDYFLGYRLPEYICGRGYIKRLPQMLKDKNAGKVLWGREDFRKFISSVRV